MRKQASLKELDGAVESLKNSVEQLIEIRKIQKNCKKNLRRYIDSLDEAEKISKKNQLKDLEGNNERDI